VGKVACILGFTRCVNIFLFYLEIALKRIIRLYKDELTGDCRKLHIEELHNLYSSPNIIRMIKSRRVRWTWHVANMGEKRNPYRVLVGIPEGKTPL
jgi:hypothetical protein